MSPRMVASLAVAAVAIAVVGCGGTDSEQTASTSTSTPTPTAASAATGGALTVRMTEYAFTPSDATAKAGKLTISAPNEGKVEHELVLLKTDADPAALPKAGDEVDESTSVGEISDVAPGETKQHSFRLKPGKYAMVCALPGHYESGMYGSLTVK